MSNEAAERLRQKMPKLPGLRAGLDASLAAERRATVERIRERYFHTRTVDGEDWIRVAALQHALDEEATR